MRSLEIKVKALKTLPSWVDRKLKILELELNIKVFFRKYVEHIQFLEDFVKFENSKFFQTFNGF